MISEMYTVVYIVNATYNYMYRYYFWSLHSEFTQVNEKEQDVQS